jgi:CheY-like chemotaxis protein
LTVVTLTDCSSGFCLLISISEKLYAYHSECPY